MHDPLVSRAPRLRPKTGAFHKDKNCMFYLGGSGRSLEPLKLQDMFASLLGELL